MTTSLRVVALDEKPVCETSTGVSGDATNGLQPALMTAAELAAEMQITERTIRRLSLRGKIGPKPLQIGRAIRYRRDEVARWFACGCPDRDTWRGMTRDR
jgi:predicted DNA-binding transcriptional regulator AlpA